jgi:hypothetical protein
MGFLQRIGPAKGGYWQIIEPDAKQNEQKEDMQ